MKVPIPRLRQIPGLPAAVEPWPSVVQVTRRIMAPGADGAPAPTGEVRERRVEV